jgi:glycoprotein endo-alpha-1,2-mannosidase
MNLSRRAFLSTAAAAGAGLMVRAETATALQGPPVGQALLSDRFADLPRHFIFEYYPWYATSPWRHWNSADRRPPIDVASNYMPALGPYDSRSRAAIERHAQWIKQSGAGAINVSWWGRGSDVDEIVPTLMDVMADYDIHVTFHLEPYGRTRAFDFARDIQYLIREYGDRRSWDCFLLLADADGTVGPVFKSFATIGAPQSTDCHGVTRPVPDYVEDSVWHQQTDRVRETFAGDFDRVTLLADCTAIDRVAAAGFDGMAIYDNFVGPDSWPLHARNFSGGNLLFSFNINAGFDGVVERRVEPDSCYRPPDFEPGRSVYDWSRVDDRDAAQRAGGARIAESLAQTIATQTDPRLVNWPRGFFLAYINSFNEWHEGTQFEPMKDREQLTREELAVGYHNHGNGSYRLDTLRTLLAGVLRPPARGRPR